MSGLGRLARPARVVAAIWKRDVRLEKTYRLAFLASLFGAVTTLVSGGFVARLVPDNQVSLRPYGGDYFTFVVLGTGSLAFLGVALGGYSARLDQEQGQGTVEPLLVTPNDPRLLLVAGAAWPLTFAVGQLAVSLLGGVALFGARIPLSRLPLLAGLLLLALASFSVVGLLAAALLVTTKRASPVLTLVTATFALLGGVLYPVSVLPAPLRAVSAVLPMTHALDGVRRALVTPLDTGAVAADALWLVGMAAVGLPAALWVLGRAVDYARRRGTLSHY